MIDGILFNILILNLFLPCQTFTPVQVLPARTTFDKALPENRCGIATANAISRFFKVEI